MIKDDMDILLEEALKPDISPSRETNQKILNKGAKCENHRRLVFVLARVVAIFIAVICVGSMGVYAASRLIKKAFVSEHAISTGPLDDDDDAAIAADEEAVQIKEVSHEDGDETVKWITKDVQILNGNITNTYYTYEEYATAVSDAGLDNWFSKTYENTASATYVVTEAEDFKEYCVDSCILYHDGSFFVSESVIRGNVSGDERHSIKIENKNNERKYTAASGYEFTLVDEITEDEAGRLVTTVVMVAYDDYFGYISFNNLTEKEIHSILDTFVIR